MSKKTKAVTKKQCVDNGGAWVTVGGKGTCRPKTAKKHSVPMDGAKTYSGSRKKTTGKGLGSSLSIKL